MKKLTVIENWINSNPNEVEVKRVENLISRMITNRSKRDYYENIRRSQKLTKIIKELETVGYPVSEQMRKDLRDLEVRIGEVKKTLPQREKRTKKE